MTNSRLLTVAPVVVLLCAVLLVIGPALTSDAETPPAPSSGGETGGAEGEKTPLLTIAAITVEPSSPGPDTLCKLRVRIDNHGTETASRFAFEVRLGGQAFAVYQDQLILQAIAPGAGAEIELHNFWSSETGRPFPKDGKMAIEVTLTEASWVRVEEKDGVETRTPVGKVEGMPVSRVATFSDRSG